ncbi:MAG: hypothetical protein ACE5G1_07245 [bacterium]
MKKRVNYSDSKSGHPSSIEIAREQRKMRQLRTIVDLTAALLYQQDLTVAEGLALIDATKQSVLQLCPGKEEAFELIYRPRFERILREKLKSN